MKRFLGVFLPLLATFLILFSAGCPVVPKGEQVGLSRSVDIPG